MISIHTLNLKKYQIGALLIGLRINALNGHTPYQGLRLGPLYDIHELLFFE